MLFFKDDVDKGWTIFTQMSLWSKFSHPFVPADLPRWPLIPALILALVFNHFKIPFFSGSELIFGNILAIAVLFFYGFMPAFLISVIAGTITYFTWYTQLNILPNALEIIVLNWAISNRRNPLIVGMLYWSTIGWLMVAVSLYVFTEMEPMTEYAITIKYFINGLLNLLLAIILVRMLAYLTGIRIYGSVQKFSELLTNQLFYIVSITLIVLSFVAVVKFFVL